MTRAISILLCGLLMLAACGDDASDDSLPDASADPAADLPKDPDAGDADGTVLAPIGPTLTVPELLAADPDQGPYVVSGYVFLMEDGRVILSETIAESYPPQPGGERLPVEGLDLQTVPFAEPPDDAALAQIRWTEIPIELIGVVVDGVFIGNTLAAT